MSQDQPSVPVSYGELIDKITILEIKSERITDAEKLKNVRHELDLLSAIWQPLDQRTGTQRSREAIDGLREVNRTLWDIEDDIRAKESAKAFDEEFVKLARAVYQTNDKRADLKKIVNLEMGSTLVEEKSYEAY